jgi:HEPN domain-containing protein
MRGCLDRLAADSSWLREERELAFYGDVDFVPSEEYDRADAERAVEAARFAVERAEDLFGGIR